MRILITGNMGYIGPVLVAHLRSVFPNSILIGFDNGLYASQLTSGQPFPERVLDNQIFGDVRDIGHDVLTGLDAVVHLAAISNDPMGRVFEKPTDEINFVASERLAQLCVAAGVSRFVFASSCSVYGNASDAPRRETDVLNPLTAYARSKIDTESALFQIASPSMAVTCLRFATARGMSPRLRLDLVLNDFVATALRTGEIKVLSDGTPWRPLIDVADMARAIEWALVRDTEPSFLAINTGADDQNYSVSQIAHEVAKGVPGTHISIDANAAPDSRSYRVDFRLFKELAPLHQPVMTLQHSIDKLTAELLKWPGFDKNFDPTAAIRLRTLERYIANGILDQDIRWTNGMSFQEPRPIGYSVNSLTDGVRIG